jgi:hypothetical protein
MAPARKGGGCCGPCSGVRTCIHRHQQQGAKAMTRIVTRIVLPLTLLTTTFALALPAQAAGTLTRTFVSSAGSNSNPCTLTAPCASFATAYAAVVPNGIIAALDPGRYGPVTITGPVTINGYGWAAITAPAAGNGITITAGASDNVALIGLEIDGAGAGYNGIVFNSGSNLTVTNCESQNFVSSGSGITTGNGILIQPTSGAIKFAITKTVVANNQNGITYSPPSGSPSANGAIDQVVATGNTFIGIDVDNFNAAGGTTFVAISNSTVSNGNIGIDIDAQNGVAPLTVSIDNVSVIGNSIGIDAQGTSNVLLGRSVISGNSFIGIANNTSSNTLFTYKDNRIDRNGTDISAPLNASTALQ